MKKKLLLAILMMTLSANVAGCGSSSSPDTNTTSETSNAVTTVSADSSIVDSADFPHNELTAETETSSLVFKQYQYASKGFLVDNSEDYTKACFIEFDYTNNDSSPKTVQEDFYITAYQNGAQLNYPTAWNPDNGPRSLEDFYNSVMNGGSITVSTCVMLQDYSPVTVEVTNYNDDSIARMIMDVEEFEDTSFDITKLYGSYEDEASGASLDLTERHIVLYYNDSSSTYNDNPDLWCDEDTLHTPLSDIEKLTITEVGPKIILSNDSYCFEKTKDALEVTGEFTTVEPGEVIETDFASLTLGAPEHGEKLTIPGTISYSVPCNTEGSHLFWIPVEYVNNSNNPVSITGFNSVVKVIFNDEKVYDAQLENVNGGNGKDLQPASRSTIYIYVEVPIDIIDSYESLSVQLGFDDEFKDVSSSTRITDLPFIYEINY